ncbi:hypothetical protein BDP55DRAFT_240910 [Colletotrichum godetiae]|uniref:Uncharacterized protein n=1 Tax=Colletotrichum godetiae TaxID=1209918 RepID=A0AAJ0EV44_9PEZI|nr:uncharacterized protein BDP55DRAFT_240910 [Colletotrichum godetiae]KAK1672864.1 hypothetical protein BDP55DRAFT_240910 [Colletotrichum godetiae]
MRYLGSCSSPSFPSFTNCLSNDECDIFLADYLLLSGPAFQSEHIRHSLQKHLGNKKANAQMGRRLPDATLLPAAYLLNLIRNTIFHSLLFSFLTEKPLQYLTACIGPERFPPFLFAAFNLVLFFFSLPISDRGSPKEGIPRLAHREDPESYVLLEDSTKTVTLPAHCALSVCDCAALLHFSLSHPLRSLPVLVHCLAFVSLFFLLRCSAPALWNPR